MAKFDPRGMNDKLYVEGHYPLPNIKAVDSVVLEKKIFLFCFLLKRICCHGNQSSSPTCPTCPKTICNLSYRPVMLCV